MNKFDFVVLGAGPAGLSFACRLKELYQQKNQDISFIVLEKEDEAGGLCRSKEADGSPFDIGGGHFLDVRRPQVVDFLFQYMPKEEWNHFERDSRIMFHDQMLSYPFESNIWQLGIDDQVDFLKSIAAAGCNQEKARPDLFIDWISWKLGSKIAVEYMIPYNQKMFGEDLNQLGTYWLDKLPSVSFEETLYSCLSKEAYGTNPGHSCFYYPRKYGYGEVWNRMAKSIHQNIIYKKKAKTIDVNSKTIICTDGCKFQASNIITTIPWLEFSDIYGEVPPPIKDGIRNLKHSSIVIEYQNVMLETDAHWIYYPDPSLYYHRILVRHNFCPGSKGIWTETNATRFSGKIGENVYYNQYAYPLNTKDKPMIMSGLLHYFESKQIYGLGRWGEHEHYNSDLTVEKALHLAERFVLNL